MKKSMSAKLALEEILQSRQRGRAVGWSQRVLAQILPAPPCCTCVNLGVWLNLSEPQVSLMSNETVRLALG